MLNWSAWLEAQGQPPVRVVAQVNMLLLGFGTWERGLLASGGLAGSVSAARCGVMLCSSLHSCC